MSDIFAPILKITEEIMVRVIRKEELSEEDKKKFGVSNR